MLSLTEALKQMTQTLRTAGYPSAVIEVNIPYVDIDAIQREEAVARAIIEESLHPKIVSMARHVKPLGIVEGVHLYLVMGQ